MTSDDIRFKSMTSDVYDNIHIDVFGPSVNNLKCWDYYALETCILTLVLGWLEHAKLKNINTISREGSLLQKLNDFS